MSFEPHDYLRHILVEADYLLESLARLEKTEFLKSETLRRAFVRSLEIIGEAAKQIPDDFTLTLQKTLLSVRVLPILSL